MKMRKIAVILGCGATLAACGGGGNIPPQTNSAEGFWLGTTADGYDVTLAVLEDGETWGIYSQGDMLEGAINGTLNGKGSAVSGSGRLYDFGNAINRVAVSGTVARKSSLDLHTQEGMDISATYDKRYDQPASLSELAGSYEGLGISGTSGGGQAIPFSIDANGRLTASVPGADCSAYGTAAPRTSGKNIFDLAVTFAGSDCALGDDISATGVAFLDTSSSPYQLLALALKSDRSDGFAWSGEKQ